MKRVIHWFRRDLRVTDNTALREAERQAEMVLPVFILEDAFRTGPDVGAARLAFLLRSLDSLRVSLRELGYPLIIRRGRSEIEIPKLCQEFGAQAVFCNRRSEPYARARDNRVCDAVQTLGVGFEVFKDAVIWEEQELLTQAGRPFTVFTPYARAWRNRPVPPPHAKLRRTRQTFPKLESDPLPIDPAELDHRLRQELGQAGEPAARERFKKFLKRGLPSYAERRNLPAADGTSQLSAHLRCGTIGIRTVLARVRAAETELTAAEMASSDAFVNELIWREFYLQILTNFPQVTKGSFRPQFDRLNWATKEDHFAAWTSGHTGYPIVDAAMRCLNATGWMHNRLRMITAMFLTKDLLISWQRGERYFMQQLVDGDLAANNGGWQWSAGTGTDAAPYFRIFNPVSQGQRFDPEGEFVKRWVPELSGVSDKHLHNPWTAPAGEQPQKYPGRVVLHEEQRPKCLAMYKAAAGKVR